MPDNGFREHDKPGWFDRTLKRWMPNGTIMRRWLALALLGGVLFGTVATLLIEQTGDNQHRSELAICAVIEYVEEQLPNIENSEAKEPLERLARRMRATGVRCPPKSIWFHHPPRGGAE